MKRSIVVLEVVFVANCLFFVVLSLSEVIGEGRFSSEIFERLIITVDFNTASVFFNKKVFG